MNPPFASISTCESSSISYSSLPPKESAFLENNDVTVYSNVTFPKDLDDSLRLTFNLGNEELYMDPLYSSFYLQFRVLTDEGKVFQPNALMGVICNPLYTMIQTCEIWANNRILRTYNNFPFIIQPTMLCQLDKNYIDSVLARTTGFYRDTNPANDRMFDANKGLLLRREMCQGSKKVGLQGRLLFVPFFQTENLIPLNCSWKIVLTMTKNDFAVLYSSIPVPPATKLQKYKIEIENAFLSLNRLKLSPHGESQIRNQIGRGLSIPFVDYRLSMLSVTKSQKEYRTPNITSASHPKLMYVFMASEVDVIGNPYHTPFNFKNYGLSSLVLTINGKEYREKCDFIENMAINSYHNLIRTLAVTSPKCFSLEYNNWTQVNTIFCFDVTPNNSAMCESYSSTTGQSAMWNISLEFANALPENVQLFILEEFEAVLQFDQENIVSIATP